jgi:hypothetical protein
MHKGLANCACTKFEPTVHAQKFKIQPAAVSAKVGTTHAQKFALTLATAHAQTFGQLRMRKSWTNRACAKAGSVHAQSLPWQLRMRKSWSKSACAKIGPNAHAQNLGHLRMRKI